jgi:hypothetical protein
MQIIRECQMRAVILTELAKEAPEFESQLLYVAEKWLMLAILSEQLNAGRIGRPTSHLRSISRRVASVGGLSICGPAIR